jgi:hypothetical protein
MHIDGEWLDAYQSSMGIAQLLDVEPGEEALICAIDDLHESYLNQCIDARNFRDGSEAMKARWEAAEGMIDEHRKGMRDMRVQLDTMGEAKCSQGKYRMRSALRPYRTVLTINKQ